ncbi:MAG: cell division protein SepF [Anaerotardibacter sp.]
MDFPRPQFSPSNLIGDLKDRFSGSRNQEMYDDYYENEYYEGYPEVDDYDVYTYDEDDRRSGGSFGRTTYVRTDGYGARSPRLVTAEDVRATTSAYGVEPSYSHTSSYDQRASEPSTPAAQRIAEMGRSARESLANISPFSRGQNAGNSNTSNSYAPYDEGYDDFYDEIEDMATPASSINDFTSAFQKEQTSQIPAQPAPSQGGVTKGIFGAQLEPNRKSAGLDNLFTPTDADYAAPQSSSAYGANQAPSATGDASYNTSNSLRTEPLYASDYTNPVHGSGREFFVMRPADFGEAESIVLNLRQDKIVVLDFKTTNPELTKRVLDFSFGVIAALEGHIECLEAKVFVMTLGSSLTLEERHRVRKQGVM